MSNTFLSFCFVQIDYRRGRRGFEGGAGTGTGTGTGTGATTPGIGSGGRFSVAVMLSIVAHLPPFGGAKRILFFCLGFKTTLFCTVVTVEPPSTRYFMVKVKFLFPEVWVASIFKRVLYSLTRLTSEEKTCSILPTTIALLFKYRAGDAE